MRAGDVSVAGHMYAHGLDGFSIGLEEFSKAESSNRELVGLDEFRICHQSLPERHSSKNENGRRWYVDKTLELEQSREVQFDSMSWSD